MHDFFQASVTLGHPKDCLQGGTGGWAGGQSTAPPTTQQASNQKECAIKTIKGVIKPLQISCSLNSRPGDVPVSGVFGSWAGISDRHNKVSDNAGTAGIHWG